MGYIGSDEDGNLTIAHLVRSICNLIVMGVTVSPGVGSILSSQIYRRIGMTKAKIFTALALALAATPAFATPEVPEPGLVPLLAVGAAVGIFLHWRSKRKKK